MFNAANGDVLDTAVLTLLHERVVDLSFTDRDVREKTIHENVQDIPVQRM